MSNNEKNNFPTSLKEERELVQSYILTFAKYNFDVYEKRVMYYILKSRTIQDYVREQIESYKTRKKTTPFTGTQEIVISLGDLAIYKGEYDRYKDAFKTLSQKGFEIEDKSKKRWAWRSFFAYPTIDLFGGYISTYIHADFIKVIAAIEHGYRKFDFNIAFNLKSVYAMRFYEMISRQDKGTYNGYFTRTIDDLKEIFGLSDKYTNNTMFVKRVIEPAKKELDENANYSFDYKLQKGDVTRKSRKKDEIEFHVYYIPENDKNEKLKENREKAILSKYIKISSTLYEYLQEIGIDESGINSNLYTFYVIEQIYFRRSTTKIKATSDLILKIDELKERALKHDRDNWVGYVIGTLKKIEKIENEKDRAEKIALYNYNKEKQNKTENKDV